MSYLKHLKPKNHFSKKSTNFYTFDSIFIFFEHLLVKICQLKNVLNMNFIWTCGPWAGFWYRGNQNPSGLKQHTDIQCVWVGKGYNPRPYSVVIDPFPGAHYSQQGGPGDVSWRKSWQCLITTGLRQGRKERRKEGKEYQWEGQRQEDRKEQWG